MVSAAKTHTENLVKENENHLAISDMHSPKGTDKLTNLENEKKIIDCAFDGESFNPNSPLLDASENDRNDNDN